MEISIISDDRGALKQIRHTRTSIAALFEKLASPAAVNQRQELFETLCDQYDLFCEQTATADFLADEGLADRDRDIDRRHRDAIDDLLFQITCTPLASRLFDAKLAVVREKLDEHLRICHRRIEGCGRPSRKTSSAPLLGDLSAPAVHQSPFVAAIG